MPIRQAGIEYSKQEELLQTANLALADQLQALEAQNKEFRNLMSSGNTNVSNALKIFDSDGQA